MTIDPNSTTKTLLNAPPNEPIGVRAPLTMTTSFIIHSFDKTKKQNAKKYRKISATKCGRGREDKI
jgi:hypothetical protein